MNKGLVQQLKLVIGLGLSCLSVAFNTLSDVGKVYYVSSVITDYDPRPGVITQYSATATFDQITGVADLDQPVSMTGMLTGALCGEFAKAYIKF